MLDRFFSSPAEGGFHWPGRLIAGSGAHRHVAALKEGKQTLIIADAAVAGLAHALLPETPFITVSGEPTEAALALLAASLPGDRWDLLIAIGGGSTMDMAKAIALMLRHGTIAVKDHPRTDKAPRLIAIPTLSGSGAETSRFSLLTGSDGLKHARRTWDAVPDLTIIDPSLIASAGRERLILGAFDTFIHLWETFICRTERNAATDMIALAHLPKLLESAARVDSAAEPEPDEVKALALASAWGGIAISNVRTGLIHTLAECLAAQLPLPHPVTLTVFFPAVMAHVVPFVPDRLQALSTVIGHPALPRIMNTWSSVLTTTSATPQVVEALNKHPFDEAALLTSVLRDTVLQKEHPAPIDVSVITALIREAIARVRESKTRINTDAIWTSSLSI
ncbi:MAG: iron-containing alcohol dehydrogenase [Alphaproteobacteria bacterium]|nr:iron-containing alcohol dehydrogenase [Alphaproteobacteria bacterium]